VSGSLKPEVIKLAANCEHRLQVGNVLRTRRWAAKSIWREHGNTRTKTLSSCYTFRSKKFLHKCCMNVLKSTNKYRLPLPNRSWQEILIFLLDSGAWVHLLHTPLEHYICLSMDWLTCLWLVCVSLCAINQSHCRLFRGFTSLQTSLPISAYRVDALLGK